MFRIDAEQCNGCGACVAVCQQKALSVIGAVARINLNRCKECGKCLEVCATGAIYDEVKEPQFVRVQRAPKFSTQGKEMGKMPFGRGWFGRGSPGMGRGMGYARGFGMGRGNPYPFCRFYPRLPRRWWAHGRGFNPIQQPGIYSPGSYYGYPAPYAWWR